MREDRSPLVFLSDPRLARHATGENPAWLWNADATCVLWGNAAAAAIFNADSPAALADQPFDAKSPAALQMARLAGTLSHGAPPRLERLRGFGGRFGSALMCACSRITLADATPAILVVATEPAGPRMPLEERARRLLIGGDGAIALFTMDGVLLQATPSALPLIGGASSLAELGASELASTALTADHATGDVDAGAIALRRLGHGGSTVLLASFESVAEKTESAGHPAEPPLDVAPPASSPPAAGEPMAERRQPLRFVWQMDAEHRFTVDSEEFCALIGAHTAAVLSRPWDEIAAALGLDTEGHVARALASHETWSGITIAFPADGTEARLPVELSGLPVFDRDRSFRGYRGFGVCRDVARMNELMRGARPATPPRIEPPLFQEGSPKPSNTPAENVLPFRANTPPDKPPTLTPVEQGAFSELASRLTARLRAYDKPNAKPDAAAPVPPPIRERTERPPARVAEPAPMRPAGSDQRPILDRLPVGVLVYRLDRLIYANRAFLDWTGYEQLTALENAGGLDALFVEANGNQLGANNGAKSLTIATSRGDQVPVEARLFTSPWEGETALVLMLTGVGDKDHGAARQPAAPDSELRAILDATPYGIVVLDRERSVAAANRSAETMFGYAAGELVNLPFVSLLAPSAQRATFELLDGPQALGDGSEVAGRRHDGSPIALFMSVRAIDGDATKLCVTFRDMTLWKKSETDILNAKRQAELASAAKSDFLAKISHEIRTPLNAIIGFTEVMMEERFGPVGNDRYRQYLKDIRTSGGHLISLLNDLLDLSKIEAGRLELEFAPLDLNALIHESVALMQPQASRERIIIRTSLSAELPLVTADARSVRQIALNLLSNSIKFTGAGGQVIVSTALGDDGNVVLRVRDTGVGMSEQDLAVALEPFRQLATSARWGSHGTGLGLPLTKALVEANRASFHIRSALHSGTLVEVAFPDARLAAE